ncbi:MAG: Fic family protein [Betaproteobacteria bacterium HGW-Betaproteobacteria-14]|nr:MAG: Fic family protein [Betaproteobacteria bacterium HGW-Betaproteobacteria-14]PKO94479.1 MAG: Fic family protein [Betaproteobacteria bacterium HGW-Betaproteobacteria-10]
MKIPLSPPSERDVVGKIPPERLARIMESYSPLAEGEYLHWDQLRHREPPGDLTPEEWWFAIKMARLGQSRRLPLLDKSSKPLLLATPEPVQIHLHHIDRDAAGEILAPGEINTPEQRNRYLLHSLIEEAITSSQLEGAATTRKVAESMLREQRKPRDRSEQMIFNNYQAMETIRGMKDEPITPERILKLHWILTEDTLDDPADAGRLRLSDDVHVADHRDGTILHQPPTYSELPERLDRLCTFANAGENATPFVHPALRAILLHFMIGYDHPFVDGNGRTARALFYWSMARSGYWLMEFLSISHFLRAAPAQYVRAYLHTETDSCDTTYFILHQLETIRKAIAALHDYLARTAEEQRSTERLLATSPKLRNKINHRQVALLAHALKHPGEVYRIDSHQRTHGTAYQTARSDLLGLVELGLLISDRGGRALLFIAPGDLQDKIVNIAG